MKENVETTTTKKVLSIVLNVIFYAFILFLLTFAIANLASKKAGNIPNIFGFGFMSVQTDSMVGEEKDSFDPGDLIFINIATDKKVENLEIGDIVSFISKNDINNNGNLDDYDTHRIVDIFINTDNQKVYITQGDNTGVRYVATGEAPENVPSNVEIHVGSEIKAVYTGKWGGVGNTLDFLQSKLGFGLCIVLPTALLLIFEAYMLIRNIMQLNKQKLLAEVEQTNAQKEAELEEQKRKWLEEMGINPEDVAKKKAAEAEAKKDTSDEE